MSWTQSVLVRVGERQLMRWGSGVATLHRHATSVVAKTDDVRRRWRVPALPAPANAWQQIAFQGLAFLVREWRRHFREARHTMWLPRFLGFTGDRDVYYGDVFQRALIADTLCDADDALGGMLQPLIECEIQYLVGRRVRVGVGGWSYFPELPELAPDADDLGQVLQLLVRTGHHAAAHEHATEPLRVLLADCMHEDGSFETWIVPAQARTATQERQLAVARARWGTGPDAEVMANLLYALVQYDARQFGDTGRRGADWIRRQQRADGSWACRWYFGPYYGTYACMRFLDAAHDDANAISRGAEFLRATQLADGGWPGQSGGDADPLSTALALLGLAVAQRVAGDESDAARAVRARLALAKMAHGGGWPSRPFIRPSGVHSYGSRTITTAMVVKAALTWSASPARASA